MSFVLPEKNVQPGEGISGLEERLRPLFKSVAEQCSKFKLTPAERIWFEGLFRTALDGRVSDMSRWGKGSGIEVPTP